MFILSACCSPHRRHTDQKTREKSVWSGKTSHDLTSPTKLWTIFTVTGTVVTRFMFEVTHFCSLSLNLLSQHTREWKWQLYCFLACSRDLRISFSRSCSTIILPRMFSPHAYFSYVGVGDDTNLEPGNLNFLAVVACQASIFFKEKSRGLKVQIRSKVAFISLAVVSRYYSAHYPPPTSNIDVPI